MSGWQRVDVSEAIQQHAPGTRAWQLDLPDEPGAHLTVLRTFHPGMGWHLSISHRVLAPDGTSVPGRYPTWDEIRDARYSFCPDNVTMAMMLPPKGNYVNVHPTTFQLFQLQEGT